MADDDAEVFQREVRAALAAACRPAEPQLEMMQRVLTWLNSADAAALSAESVSDDEEHGAEGDEGRNMGEAAE